MKIFKTEVSKKEIMEKIGDITQLGGIKSYEFSDGVSRGVRAIDLKSPCGLDMTILPDRGMDISNLSYKSIPICWKSATRETSPIYYESKEWEWLRTFFGGLITTCGLSNIGDPNVDISNSDLSSNEELGLHGRISNISAENVSAEGKWENNTYVMSVKGEVREAMVLGDKLQLERKITTWMDEPKIIVEDVVENIGHNTSPLMILYHVNIGYPIIDNGARLIEGETSISVGPRNEESKAGIKEFNKFHGPVKDYKEQVFTHDIKADKEGYSNIALVNENFEDGKGIGIWLRFNKDNLPYLTQWKQMGMGEYLCGIEPSNSLIEGRNVERKEGRLKFIEPGERVNYRLEFNILKSNDDIKEFEKNYCV